ncbi:hypothetical protein C8F01DRAFT_490469 [Mycena amicta]|nr:hypothetical protein C8F01DRAFT_490469 [Mycena amicta]
MLTALNTRHSYIHALASTTGFKDIPVPRPASGASNSSRAFSGTPSAPRVKTSEKMTSRPTTWSQVIFKTNEYTLSQIKGCLALEIGDLLPNILQLLSDRTQAELCNTDNDLAKVDILFKVINSRTGDLELLRSFCRQLARFVGMKHMLRLDVYGFNYEEILSSELLGPSGAAYRREGLRRSIAQSRLTARRKARPHPYRRTSSTSGRVKPHSARRAASDSEAVSSHSDSVPETVCLHDIAFTEELGSGTTFFMHTAKHKGRPVVVKVFNATANPHQLVEKEIQLAKELIHPNLLRLEGVSAPASPTQFITYQSAITADRHLGTALDANLETSVALAFQMVGELAAGLNYLHLQRIPVQRIQITHFNVLFDSDQKFLIALDPAALDQAPVSSSPVQVGIDVLWRHFNELCELVLKSANRLIHDDDVERDPDVVDLSSPYQ